MISSLLSLLLIFSSSGTAENAVRPGELLVDPPTLHCLGFRWYVDGDQNGNAACSIEFRRKGDDGWRAGLELLRVNRETVNRDYESHTCDNLLAGSLFGLEPDAEYEIMLSLSDPDGGKATKTCTVRTRAVPKAPAPKRSLHLYPAKHEGKKELPSFVSLAEAVKRLKPGDHVLLHAGVHTGNVVVERSGTVSAPIVFKAAGDGEAIVQGTNGSDKRPTFNFVVTDQKHIWFEGLTLKGAEWGIRAEATEHLVVRRCRILDVSTGIRTYSERAANWYIADNEIIGRNTQWYPRNSQKASHTGINFFGRGHVVCHNRIRKFWDCLAIANYGIPKKGRDLKCVSIDMYGNDLSEALDDCLETDYGCHNIRVWGNRFWNAHVALSAQPTYGGPIYMIRNCAFNIAGLTLKLHNWCSGLMIFHNTLITPGQAFRSYHRWQNGILRNNLLLGGQRYAMETGSPHPRTSMDYNGWRKTNDPQRFMKWHDDKTWTRYATLEAFAKSTGHERHGVMVDFNVFEKCPFPKPEQFPDPSVYDFGLRPASKPIDSGVVLPNINEDFKGKAPDLGCREFGGTGQIFGPR